MNTQNADADRLASILDTMDVPEQRRSDLRWLQRNIVIRNGNHDQLAEALTLIRRLVKKGNES